MSLFARRSTLPTRIVAHGVLAGVQVLALADFGWPLAEIHGFSLDDAWIHQVVARTFATTGTLGYLAGHHGAGATSYLWATILALNFRFLHFDPVYYTLVVNTVASLAAGQCLLAMLVRAYGDQEGASVGSVKALAAAALATFGGNFLWLTYSGMEASIFVALSLGAILLTDVEGPRSRLAAVLAGACAAGVALTRPEGALLGPLLVAGTWRRARKREAATLAAAWGLGPAIYLGSNLFASHTLLPSTLAGRRWLWLEGSGLGRWTQLRDFFEAWLLRLRDFTLGTSSNLAFWISLGCAALGTAWVVRSRGRSLKLLLAWAAVHHATYAVLLPTAGHAGRYQPLSPLVYLALVALGSIELVHGLARRVAGQRAVVARAALAAVAALVPWAGLVGVGVRDWRGDHAKAIAHIRATEVGLGGIIDRLPEGAKVASFDIGASGFFSHRPILDLGGLVDPSTVPTLKAGGAWAYLRDHAVDYVVLPVGYLPLSFPDAVNFGQRLELFDNPAVYLEPVRELDTPIAFWAPGVNCTGNSAPRQVVFHVDYTGREGPLPPRSLGSAGTLEDPNGVLGSRDREAIVYGLGVLSGYGVDVDLALSPDRLAGARPDGQRWRVEIGPWGVTATPPPGSRVPEPALEGLMSEWLEPYLDVRDVPGAARVALHAVAAAYRRFVEPRFDPSLPPPNAVQPAPESSPRTTALWGLPLVALVFLVGSASASSRDLWRRLGLLGAAPLLLLACGRRVPDVVADGDSALADYLARTHANVDERLDGRTGLHAAAAAGDARSIRVLLASHADPNALDEAGNSPLVTAALAGQDECVDALLVGGAEPNLPCTSSGWRPLHAGVLSGSPGVLERLLRGGADPNGTNLSGETALHFAAKLDAARAELATRVLLAHGASLLARDVRGFTPLHVAAVHDTPVMVGAFRDRALDLDLPSAWGQAPLDLAIEHASDKVADALFAAGAHTLMTDDPLPPLLDAARMNDVPRLERLLAAGADRQQTYEGKTASDVAGENASDGALDVLGTTLTKNGRR